MNQLERNMTTAAQAMALEDRVEHPMREGTHRGAPYFAMLRARRELPVSKKRQEFLTLYQEEQVLVVVGETGSGKSTQIPQFVLFDEWESGMKVVCTHPLRMAASSVAKRVAEEMAVPLGEEVGYRIRFDERMNIKNRLAYMTDGMLLAMTRDKRNFPGCCTIIIDKAHERTIATDFLMALLKQAPKVRNDLKVIIMSATLDAAKFQAYFGGAKLLQVPGRSFPVDIRYLSEATPHYGVTALRTVKHIHENIGPGDILVFLPSINEIEYFCSEVRASTNGLETFALYSGMASERESRAVARTKSGCRKCIVATNIAEISVTIEGIVYVVDAGLVKQAGFNPRASLNTLQTATISKASAAQRAGRAGRTKPGLCFRLYTEETLNEIFLASTPPEMVSHRLTPEILLLKSIGIHEVGLFDFIDRPHSEVYYQGLEELFDMGYIDDAGKITASGREAAKLPVDPLWHNALIEARSLGCLGEVVGIAALSTVQSQHSIFLRPHAFAAVADEAHRQFDCPMSDHITQLNALHAFVEAKKDGDADDWCRHFFLNRRVLEDAVRLRAQLIENVQPRLGLVTIMDYRDENYETNICKALARSLFCNVAIRDPAAKGKGPAMDNDDELYRTVHRNHQAGLDMDSVLVGSKAELVVFDKFVYTGWQQHLHTVTAIKPEWVMDLPYFQDDHLARKRSGVLRQPYVKASLDRAREGTAASSASTSA
ncbi:hypothetical protein NCS52_00322000 [Fusarium sp. LHS14.1]|nr:hypothetical protein NCS52_00322000 [Fusarium sp. LHS14.1]